MTSTNQPQEGKKLCSSETLKTKLEINTNWVNGLLDKANEVRAAAEKLKTALEALEQHRQTGMEFIVLTGRK